MNFKKALAPEIIIFIGVALTAVGGLIAAWQAKKDSKLLEEKNQKIIELTEKNALLTEQALNEITGGDSWAFLRSGLQTANGIMNQKSLFNLNLQGQYPIYDVTLDISEIEYDRNLPTKAYTLNSVFSKQIGTVTKTIYSEPLWMWTPPKGKKEVEYLIKMKARNGEVVQHLILILKPDNFWSVATKVFRFNSNKEGGFAKENLLEQKDSDFPNQDVQWIEF